jgi:hypothetical protein
LFGGGGQEYSTRYDYKFDICVVETKDVWIGAEERRRAVVFNEREHLRVIVNQYLIEDRLFNVVSKSGDAGFFGIGAVIGRFEASAEVTGRQCVIVNDLDFEVAALAFVESFEFCGR